MTEYINKEGQWVTKIDGYVVRDEHVVGMGQQQIEVMKAFTNGENILMHGPAGTGKSVTIRRIRALLDDGGICYEIAALTGPAAVNIQGTTIHRIFRGLGLMKDTGEKLFSKMKRLPELMNRILFMQVLIIDEISMVSAGFLDKIDYLIRACTKIDKPFGGKQVFFSGDFYQLEPIERGENGKHFAFQSDVWSEIKLSIIEMSTIYRQTDRDFVDILQKMRVGRLDIDSISSLIKRVNVRLHSDDGVVPTSIFAHNKDADKVNNQEIMKLDSKTERLFESSCVVNAKNGITETDMKELYRHSMQVRTHSVAPDDLKLRIGAQVMLRYNMNIQNQLVNGSRGVVVSYTHDGQGVVVAFLNGRVCKIMPHEFITEMKTGTITFTQLPLILAWAMTIHKSQGSTMDLLMLSTSHIRSHGQAYVAFSRCRSIDSISLIDFDPRCIHVDPAVLAAFPPPPTQILIYSRKKKRKQDQECDSTRRKSQRIRAGVINKLH
jgi:ATP-dependent DNA helicase PIF1